MYSNLALSENGFLFDSRTGSTYSLNRTGTHILRALIDGVSVEDLPAKLESTFEMDPAVCDRDIEQFLFRLKDLGFIREEDEL
ncbi:MAG: HPr-rel-A system PqqD family peptide chaperone [Deltaproteobacteria bacterium]|nr:HPr-rel-A system PqqD family peptide chaperone [Deltaproteobacteria bacterium]